MEDPLEYEKSSKHETAKKDMDELSGPCDENVTNANWEHEKTLLNAELPTLPNLINQEKGCLRILVPSLNNIAFTQCTRDIVKGLGMTIAEENLGGDEKMGAASEKESSLPNDPNESMHFPEVGDQSIKRTSEMETMLQHTNQLKEEMDKYHQGLVDTDLINRWKEKQNEKAKETENEKPEKEKGKASTEDAKEVENEKPEKEMGEGSTEDATEEKQETVIASPPSLDAFSISSPSRLSGTFHPQKTILPTSTPKPHAAQDHLGEVIANVEQLLDQFYREGEEPVPVPLRWCKLQERKPIRAMYGEDSEYQEALGKFKKNLPSEMTIEQQAGEDRRLLREGLSSLQKKEEEQEDLKKKYFLPVCVGCAPPDCLDRPPGRELIRPEHFVDITRWSHIVGKYIESLPTDDDYFRCIKAFQRRPYIAKPAVNTAECLERATREQKRKNMEAAFQLQKPEELFPMEDFRSAEFCYLARAKYELPLSEITEIAQSVVYLPTPTPIEGTKKDQHFKDILKWLNDSDKIVDGLRRFDLQAQEPCQSLFSEMVPELPQCDPPLLEGRKIYVRTCFEAYAKNILHGMVRKEKSETARVATIGGSPRVGKSVFRHYFLRWFGHFCRATGHTCRVYCIAANTVQQLSTRGWNCWDAAREEFERDFFQPRRWNPELKKFTYPLREYTFESMHRLDPPVSVDESVRLSNTLFFIDTHAPSEQQVEHPDWPHYADVVYTSSPSSSALIRTARQNIAPQIYTFPGMSDVEAMRAAEVLDLKIWGILTGGNSTRAREITARFEIFGSDAAALLNSRDIDSGISDMIAKLSCLHNYIHNLDVSEICKITIKNRATLPLMRYHILVDRVPLYVNGTPNAGYNKARSRFVSRALAHRLWSEINQQREGIVSAVSREAKLATLGGNLYEVKVIEDLLTCMVSNQILFLKWLPTRAEEKAATDKQKMAAHSKELQEKRDNQAAQRDMRALSRAVPEEEPKTDTGTNQGNTSKKRAGEEHGSEDESMRKKRKVDDNPEETWLGYKATWCEQDLDPNVPAFPLAGDNRKVGVATFHKDTFNHGKEYCIPWVLKSLFEAVKTNQATWDALGWGIDFDPKKPPPTFEEAERKRKNTTWKGDGDAVLDLIQITTSASHSFSAQGLRDLIKQPELRYYIQQKKPVRFIWISPNEIHLQEAPKLTKEDLKLLVEFGFTGFAEKDSWSKVISFQQYAIALDKSGWVRSLVESLQRVDSPVVH